MPLIVLASLFFSVSLHAGWTRTYGGAYSDSACGIIELFDGYMVLATTQSISGDSLSIPQINTDIWLLRLNSLGDTIWTRTYGGNLLDLGYHFEQTADGYIIAGLKDGVWDQGYTEGDLWLIKVDSLGDTVWTRTYGGSEYDEARYVHQTADGGYMVMGRTASFGAGGFDIWILKTDSLGDTLWSRTYGGDEDDWFWSADHVVSDDDGYIILGDWWSYFFNYSLLRIDKNGDSLWIKTEYYDYPGWNLFDACYVVQRSPEQGSAFVIVGRDKGGPYNFHNVWIAQTSFLGDSLWIRNFGGEERDQGCCVAPTAYGELIVVGYTMSFGKDGSADIWLLKIEGWCDTSWTRTYGGPQSDVGYRVIETSDKGFLIGGWTQSYGNGDEDVFLIKTDSLGYPEVAEQPPVTHLEIANSIGREIVMRYSDHPQGFHASVFDASGRKVDELHSSVTSGTLFWGDGQSPGVYFIVPGTGKTPALKVVLVR